MSIDPRKPTVILCKTCMQVIENGECQYCAAKAPEGDTEKDKEAFHRPAPITMPKPREVINLVELRPARTIKLTSNRITIGRDPSNTLSLPEDPYVSRNHALITFEEGKFWVEDLGSKNGSKVNGAEILDREPIERGDIVTVGSTNFLVE